MTIFGCGDGVLDLDLEYAFEGKAGDDGDDEEEDEPVHIPAKQFDRLRREIDPYLFNVGSVGQGFLAGIEEYVEETRLRRGVVYMPNPLGNDYGLTDFFIPDTDRKLMVALFDRGDAEIDLTIDRHPHDRCLQLESVAGIDLDQGIAHRHAIGKLHDDERALTFRERPDGIANSQLHQNQEHGHDHDQHRRKRISHIGQVRREDAFLRAQHHGEIVFEQAHFEEVCADLFLRAAYGILVGRVLENEHHHDPRYHRDDQ